MNLGAGHTYHYNGPDYGRNTNINCQCAICKDHSTPTPTPTPRGTHKTTDGRGGTTGGGTGGGVGGTDEDGWIIYVTPRPTKKCPGEVPACGDFSSGLLFQYEYVPGTGDGPACLPNESTMFETHSFTDPFTCKKSQILCYYCQPNDTPTPTPSPTGTPPPPTGTPPKPSPTPNPTPPPTPPPTPQSCLCADRGYSPSKLGADWVGVSIMCNVDTVNHTFQTADCWKPPEDGTTGGAGKGSCICEDHGYHSNRMSADWTGVGIRCNIKEDGSFETRNCWVAPDDSGNGGSPQPSCICEDRGFKSFQQSSDWVGVDIMCDVKPDKTFRTVHCWNPPPDYVDNGGYGSCLCRDSGYQPYYSQRYPLPITIQCNFKGDGSYTTVTCWTDDPNCNCAYFGKQEECDDTQEEIAQPWQYCKDGTVLKNCVYCQDKKTKSPCDDLPDIFCFDKVENFLGGCSYVPLDKNDCLSP
jgi:hypothetical protein